MNPAISTSSFSQALDRAQARGLLPTRHSSREARQYIEAGIRRNAVWSSRTGNLYYVQGLKDRIARLLQGGRGNDPANIRLELKRELQRLGYTPEKGFPGDSAFGVPAAKAGSLRDLSSDTRINLILKTQEELMRGAALEIRGNDGTRQQQFPAWELVRVGPRKAPRGSASGSKSWPERWEEAGGNVYGGRMVALKTDPVWAALGNGELFSDALDTSHPPFAFNSGMGWREIHWSDAEKLLGKDGLEQIRKASSQAESKPKKEIIPALKVSTSGLDKTSTDALREALRKSKEKYGAITTDGILSGEVRL